MGGIFGGGEEKKASPTPGYKPGEQVWYVDPGGLATDPQSMANWSKTPRAGWVEATPTGRYYDSQYDPNNQYIPEFSLPDGRTFKGLDRGPGDGSRTNSGSSRSVAAATGTGTEKKKEKENNTSTSNAAAQKASNQAQGRRSASTTGAQGLLGQAAVRRKTLLGA
jgi:hypothetical protein